MLRHLSSWTCPLHSTLSTTPSCVGACSHHSACLVQRYDGSSGICILDRSTSDVVRQGLQSCIFFVECRKDRCLDLFCSLSTWQIWLLSLNGTVFILTCMPTIHRFTASSDLRSSRFPAAPVGLSPRCRYMDKDKPTATQHQQDGLALMFRCPPSTPAANHSSQSRSRSRQPFILGAGPWHLH